VQDKVNQEESEQDEVDEMKEEADSMTMFEEQTDLKVTLVCDDERPTSPDCDVLSVETRCQL